jgi:SNF2 family DNA or RNA helicase
MGMILDFEWSVYKVCLLGDEVGLGKTCQILGLHQLNPIYKPMLVIAPASFLGIWVSEIRKFLNLPTNDVVVY